MEELTPVCAQCQRPIEKGRKFCSMRCRSTYWRLNRRHRVSDEDAWERIFSKHVDPHYYDRCKFGQEWKGRFQHA